jgi:hypothetical protein
MRHANRRGGTGLAAVLTSPAHPLACDSVPNFRESQGAPVGSDREIRGYTLSYVELHGATGPKRTRWGVKTRESESRKAKPLALSQGRDSRRRCPFLTDTINIRAFNIFLKCSSHTVVYSTQNPK